MMLTTLQEEILQEKIKNRDLEIGKKLFLKGYPIEDIVDVTGLSLEEIKNLEKEIKS